VPLAMVLAETKQRYIFLLTQSGDSSYLLFQSASLVGVEIYKKRMLVKLCLTWSFKKYDSAGFIC